METRQRTLFYLGIILLIGSLIYAPAFEAGFYFDDIPSIRHNAAIRHLDIRSIWDFWPTRFLTYFSLALNFQISGLEPFGYHLANVIIHIVNTLLIFFMVRRLLKSSGLIPFFASLLFLCHPVQTQAVTYVIQRAASLATCFFLLSVLFYQKACSYGWMEEEKPQRSFNYPFYISLIFCICAMFTKEFTVTLPIILILLEFLVLKDRRKSTSQKIKRLLPFMLAIFIIPVIVITHSSNPHMNDSGQIEWVKESGITGEVAPGHAESVKTYLLTQPRVFITYLRLLVFPVSQTLDYDYPKAVSFLSLSVIIPLIVMAGLLISAWLLRKKMPLFFFGICWFFITLLPESSVIPILDVIAEHRLYLPLVGLVLVVAAALGSCSASALKKGLILCGAVTGCFCLLTFQRNLIWKDPITLWEDSVKKAGAKARVHGNLGKAYLDKGRYLMAAREFEKVIELDPGFSSAYNNLAVIYIDHYKDFKRAEKYVEQTLSIFPNHPGAYLNRGVIHLNRNSQNRVLDDLEKAVRDFEKVLELDPKDSTAHLNLGACYINIGDIYRKEAFHFRKTGEAKAARAKTAAAIESFSKAERILKEGVLLWPEDYRCYRLLARIGQNLRKTWPIKTE